MLAHRILAGFMRRLQVWDCTGSREPAGVFSTCRFGAKTHRPWDLCRFQSVCVCERECHFLLFMSKGNQN